MPRALVVALLLLTIAVACSDDDGGAAPGSGSPTGSLLPSSTASPGQTLGNESPTETPSGLTYVIQAGDTLYSIANRFGTTVEAIAAANSITDPGEIEVGQEIVIPDGVQPTAPPATQPPAGETPPSTGAAQVIRYGDTSRNIVALTFDAGSDAGYSVQILDTLAANGLHASFGMTGKFAEAYPTLVKRMADEGHSFINHTYSHRSFTGNSDGLGGLGQAERWQELDRTEQIIRDLTGATTKPYFRPPYGDYDDSVNADVGARGYAYNVMWAVDSRGWTGIPAAEITARCLQLAEPGAIYVFHVGSASQDGPALQSLIDGLQAAGYQITDLPGSFGE
ncbi:MAG: polysaccharide deacetylase family protein [Dehalococcoidia bacterium]